MILWVRADPATATKISLESHLDLHPVIQRNGYISGASSSTRRSAFAEDYGQHILVSCGKTAIQPTIEPLTRMLHSSER
jgi:hypothetical protein